jgi:hypothetical protein
MASCVVFFILSLLAKVGVKSGTCRIPHLYGDLLGSVPVTTGHSSKSNLFAIRPIFHPKNRITTTTVQENNLKNLGVYYSVQRNLSR